MGYPMTYNRVVNLVAAVLKEWMRDRRITRWYRLWRYRAARCQSCGGPAEVLLLRDRSTWCIPCDLSARQHCYDNEPVRLLR